MASVDQGPGIIMGASEARMTPASPQPNAANGGAPATTHGWYSEPAFGLLVQGVDLPGVIIGGSSSLPTGLRNWIMQAYESGGSCTGKVRRTWTSVSAGPDLSASQYSGSRCSPTPGTFSDFSFLEVF